MKEKPILFSGPMVRSILDGRKTMTRRVCKLIPPSATCPACPYGQPGDRLWVRENFWCAEQEGHGIGVQRLFYSADHINPNLTIGVNHGHVWCGPEMAWGHHPSIHMPRWASRITLEVVSVRVERVQDISETDAKAEGVESVMVDGREYGLQTGNDYKWAFNQLWDSINAERGYGWAVNPWVWVVEFKRVTP